MNQITWYNIVAPFYNYFMSFSYRKVRKESIRSLELSDGDIVIDLGCGTGLNLEMLSSKVGSNGLVIGIEPSVKMYQKANKIASKYNNIVLLNMTIDKAIEDGILNGYKSRNIKILSTLVFSVIQDYRSTAKNIISFFDSGTVVVIMDLYKKNSNLFSLLLDFLAFSKMNRKVWEAFKENIESLEFFNLCCFMGIKAYIVKIKL
jgi:ubiquinone/menaquinone biosynthesis C-methylase UbiE